MKEQYSFLWKKHKLLLNGAAWKFSRLRPAAFPTIRIAQLATLVCQSPRWFGDLIHTGEWDAIKYFFQQLAVPWYWHSHYQFDKISVPHLCQIGDDTIALIVINAISPVSFLYGIKNAASRYQAQALAFLENLPPESNRLIREWKTMGVQPASAGESQALLHWRKHYCEVKKCLDCAVGCAILKAKFSQVYKGINFLSSTSFKNLFPYKLKNLSRNARNSLLHPHLGSSDLPAAVGGVLPPAGLLFFRPEILPSNFEYRYPFPFEEVDFDMEDGGQINGIHFRVPNSRGVVFYFKGNSKSIKGWGKFARDFISKGYDFFLMDYRGFGKSMGKRTEAALFNDGQFVYKWLTTQYPEDKIIIYGRSLGSGIAARIASWNRPKMLLLDSPAFPSTDIRRYGFWLPLKWLLKYKIRTDQFLKKISCPVFILHGDRDRLIPFNQSLLLAAGQPRDGAPHQDRWWRAQQPARLPRVS